MDYEGYSFFGIYGAACNECDGGEHVLAKIGFPGIGEDWTEGLQALGKHGLTMRFLHVGPERYWMISLRDTETRIWRGCNPIRVPPRRDVDLQTRVMLGKMATKLGWNQPTWLLALNDEPRDREFTREG